jgi:hypothetical protein
LTPRLPAKFALQLSSQRRPCSHFRGGIALSKKPRVWITISTELNAELHNPFTINQIEPVPQSQEAGHVQSVSIIDQAGQVQLEPASRDELTDDDILVSSNSKLILSDTSQSGTPHNTHPVLSWQIAAVPTAPITNPLRVSLFPSTKISRTSQYHRHQHRAFLPNCQLSHLWVASRIHKLSGSSEAEDHGASRVMRDTTARSGVAEFNVCQPEDTELSMDVIGLFGACGDIK